MRDPVRKPKQQHLYLIFVCAIVINISLLNGCVKSDEVTKLKSSFTPEKIGKPCAEKCSGVS